METNNLSTHQYIIRDSDGFYYHYRMGDKIVFKKSRHGAFHNTPNNIATVRKHISLLDGTVTTSTIPYGASK